MSHLFETDEVNHLSPAAWLGKMRRQGRIQRKQDLPTHRGSISKNFGIQGNDLSTLAVLDLGSRDVTILVSESNATNNQHIALREKIIGKGYKISDERLADIALIAEINVAINSGSTLNTESSDVRPIVDELLSYSIDKETTDLHLRCVQKEGITRTRIHGRMYNHRAFDIETMRQIASYMFTHMAEPRTRSTGTFSVEQKSMSCMIAYTHKGNQYKLRYKYKRLAYGWHVVIRILPEEVGKETQSFLALGYEESQVALLEQSVCRAIGLVIITGPTGSGKSTTLKTMMDFDPNKKSKNRVTVEDPVEFNLEDTSQISVQRNDHEIDDNNHEFHGILRDVLRLDPDDVMVGETRDHVVAQMVADFVLTGHKIYTTAHTASAMTTPMRLFRLGIDRAILGDRQFFSVLMFQRLMPVLCNNCKVPAIQVLDKKRQHLLSAKFGLNINHIYCRNDSGCEHCKSLGIVSSTVVAEVIVPDRVIRQHITEGNDDKAEIYWRQSRTSSFDDPNMQGKTAFEHGIYKVSLGMIDPRDLELEFEPLESYEIIEAQE